MLSHLLALLRLIRFGNLSMVLLTQVFTYFFLSVNFHPSDLLQPSAILLFVTTILVTAAGYIINDYHDVKADIVNKPGKVIVGYTVSRRQAIFYYVTFNLLAIAFSIQLNRYVALAVLLCIMMLWFYSVSLKRKFLTGNLLVAILAAMVLVIVGLGKEMQVSLYLWVYAIFAFTIHLIREIIKDLEDEKGDLELGCRTIPIVMGTDKTKRILYVLTGIKLIEIIGFMELVQATGIHETGYFSILFYLYMLLMLLVPVLLLGILIYKADRIIHYKRLSLLCKLIMLSGILSMLFVR